MTVPSVPLANLAMKTTVEKLTAVSARSDERPPRRADAQLAVESPVRLQSIAVYLLLDQITNPQTLASPRSRQRVPGVRYDLYTGPVRPMRGLEIARETEGRLPTRNLSSFSLEIPKLPEHKFRR